MFGLLIVPGVVIAVIMIFFTIFAVQNRLEDRRMRPRAEVWSQLTREQVGPNVALAEEGENV